MMTTKGMHCLSTWEPCGSSKSRLVTQISEAENNQQKMKLRPKNVTPVEWRKFVKLKTSQEFKVWLLT